MTTQAMLWTAAGACAATAVVAAVADHRRAARRNLDNPGWVPWAGVQLLAMLLAAVAAALALKV
jgi:hypothetical protein